MLSILTSDEIGQHALHIYPKLNKKQTPNNA
jgi:hypothetical protein